jgi:DNA-binding MarR family transcriptional regulator
MTDSDTEDGLDFGVLDGSLGLLLRLAQLRSFATFYEDMAGFDLKPGAFSVLMMIEANPGIRQGVLARALTIKRAHMTKLIRALEDDGLVSRTVPSDDKRSVELWLSNEGHEKLSGLKAAFTAHEHRLAAPLSPAQAQRLKELLKLFTGADAPPKGN